MKEVYEVPVLKITAEEVEMGLKEVFSTCIRGEFYHRLAEDYKVLVDLVTSGSDFDYSTFLQFSKRLTYGIYDELVHHPIINDRVKELISECNERTTIIENERVEIKGLTPRNSDPLDRVICVITENDINYLANEVWEFYIYNRYSSHKEMWDAYLRRLKDEILCEIFGWIRYYIQDYILKEVEKEYRKLKEKQNQKEERHRSSFLIVSKFKPAI